jgi:hypothetical protein
MLIILPRKMRGRHICKVRWVVDYLLKAINKLETTNFLKKSSIILKIGLHYLN